MRLLIIGGTGRISTGITSLLIERGDRLTLFTRGKTEAEVQGPIETATGDRRDFSRFERWAHAQKHFDCVIDMVALTRVEVESAIRAFQGRTGHYIFCSTVDVYTKPAARYPTTEDAEREPSKTFLYAYEKMDCERTLFAAHEKGQLVVTSIRPGHTYVDRLLHTLGRDQFWIDRMRKGLPLLVHGDGNSLWSVCARDDVARAFVGAVGNARTFGRAYHVAGEEWITWNRYYETVAAAAGAPKPSLVHVPVDVLAKVDPARSVGCKENFQFTSIFDNSRARADLGFQYTIPFDEGAKRAVKRMEERKMIELAAKHPWYDSIIAAWQRLGERMVEEYRERQVRLVRHCRARVAPS